MRGKKRAKLDKRGEGEQAWEMRSGWKKHVGPWLTHDGVL